MHGAQNRNQRGSLSCEREARRSQMEYDKRQQSNCSCQQLGRKLNRWHSSWFTSRHCEEPNESSVNGGLLRDQLFASVAFAQLNLLIHTDAYHLLLACLQIAPHGKGYSQVI